jgi:hypothetical protein
MATKEKEEKEEKEGIIALSARDIKELNLDGYKLGEYSLTETQFNDLKTEISNKNLNLAGQVLQQWWADMPWESCIWDPSKYDFGDNKKGPGTKPFSEAKSGGGRRKRKSKKKKSKKRKSKKKKTRRRRRTRR